MLKQCLRKIMVAYVAYMDLTYNLIYKGLNWTIFFAKSNNFWNNSSISILGQLKIIGIYLDEGFITGFFFHLFCCMF